MTRVDAPDYLLKDTETDAESVRLGLLESWQDPGTRRRITALNIRPGARCLEVGAGRGSIARWLATEVAPQGTVAAADIDCRFLTGVPTNVEVRQLDIRRDDLEPDTYDLIHCRALLGHLPDPAGALRRMASALCPGGVLLAEEVDDGLFCYSGHPDARWATERWRRQTWGWRCANRANVYLGRTLPGLLTDAGLQLDDGEIDTEIARFGDPAFEWHRLSLDALAPPSIAGGFLSRYEHARVMRMMRSRSTVFTGHAVVACWARRTPCQTSPRSNR